MYANLFKNMQTTNASEVFEAFGPDYGKAVIRSIYSNEVAIAA